MSLSPRKCFATVALLLLALGLRIGLPAAARESPLGHHSVPALTNGPANPSETSLPDSLLAPPARCIHKDGLRSSRLLLVALTRIPTLLLVTSDLAPRAPPL